MEEKIKLCVNCISTLQKIGFILDKNTIEVVFDEKECDNMTGNIFKNREQLKNFIDTLKYEE
jgi:hypothetical protein